MADEDRRREWKVSSDRLETLRTIDTKGGRETVLNVSVSCNEGKEYDLKALVRGRSGALNYLGTTRPDEIGALYDGAVSLWGFDDDPTTKGLTIKWHPGIASIALSAYSLKRNGKGAFREDGVSVWIQPKSGAAGPMFRLDADKLTGEPRQYTLYFGEVIFTEYGQLEVNARQLYSRPGSRNMLAYEESMIVLDAGPEAQLGHRSSSV